MNNCVMNYTENASGICFLEKNIALQVASYLERKGDITAANKLLSIIANSIKEDKKNYFSTNYIKLNSKEEEQLFNLYLQN